MAGLMKAVKIGDKVGIFYNHQIEGVELVSKKRSVRVWGVTYPLYELKSTNNGAETLLPLLSKIAIYQLADCILENEPS